MKKGPDISTIYRIARCYYAEGLSQEEIAANEGFSRSQISRLIEKAKELGLVKISLVPPSSEKTEELSRTLMEMFSLRCAMVVPVPRNAHQEEITAAIATCAADYLVKALDGFSVIGLGWGRTMYKTAQMLSQAIHSSKKPLFVPLIGISGDKNPNLQINTIIDRFSTAFKSQGLFINTPSVREKGAPISRIEQSRIAALKAYWDEIEAAVFGLGTAPSQSQNLIDELPQQYKEELIRSPACGDILAQFFDPTGIIFHAEHEYDLLAFDITRLPRLKRRICLAGGEGKATGILAALHKRYISDLVTDERTAENIINLALKSNQRMSEAMLEKEVNFQ
jgi:deoxyribonucleoside regulator